jgi:flagellar biosynthesis protein FlhF
MRVRVYESPSMATAMARIRAELGADALILASRRVAGGVAVTAAIDAPDDPADAPPSPPPPSSSPPPAAGRDAMLTHHRMPRAVALRLQSGPLGFALAAAFRYTTLDFTNAAPLLLAGPPGSGKTLTTARLATRLVLAGARPLVITADARRAGAFEQLAAFTRLLGLHLVSADTPLLLSQAIRHRAADAPVLIDAPGVDLFDPLQRRLIGELAAASGATVALVLAAGLDPAEAADLAAASQGAGARLLVATRLDQARRLGGILAAADTGLAMAEAGIGPHAADGLVPLTATLLATTLTRLAPAQDPRT